MKKLLIVSPFFPPASTPDLQRVRMSLPHYRTFGWDPVVLTVEAGDQHVLEEADLLKTIPADIRVEKVKALPYRLLTHFGIRNIGIRAWIALWKRGDQLIREEHFDAIFFSTTQFFVFPLGALWQRRYGIPYILDIQDPWLTDYYYQKGVSKPPGGWKYHISHLMAWLLEGWTYRNASGFISVSARYFEELQSRHAWFKQKAQATIRFGASREDQKAALRISLAPGKAPERQPENFHFVYTGAAGPIMPKALNAFFDGLHHYRQSHPEKAARFRFHFLGTSYAPPEKARPSVFPIAQEWKVDDLVVEIPCRLGFLECLRHQAEADVLLLLGSSDPAYSPSKLYTYFLSNRPILAPVFKGSVLENMIKELNCACIIPIGDMVSKDEIRREMARFFDDMLAGFPSGALPERDHPLFERRYLAKTLTREQCLLFDLVLDGHRHGHPLCGS